MCPRTNKGKQQKVLQDIENLVEDTVQKSNNNDEDKKKDSPPSLSRLLQSMKHEKGMIFVGFLFLLANESTTQAIPLLVAKAYDAIIVGISSSSSSALENDEESTTTGNRMKLVNYYMGLSMIIFCVGSLCTFFRFSIFSVAAERIVARLRNDLYSSIIIQDIAFFDEHKSGELISRLSSDTSLVQNVVSMSIPETITNVMKAIVSIVLIFTISPKLAAMSVGTISVIIVASAPLGLKLGALSKAYQDALGNAQTCSTEALGTMVSDQFYDFSTFIFFKILTLLNESIKLQTLNKYSAQYNHLLQKKKRHYVIANILVILTSSHFGIRQKQRLKNGLTQPILLGFGKASFRADSSLLFSVAYSAFYMWCSGMVFTW